MANYKITLFTGEANNAGTDANVFISVFGNSSSFIHYALDNAGNDREQGSIDTYSIETNYLGNLHTIRIRHDNTGDRPGWFLNKVSILHEESGSKWNFPYYNWLAIDQGQTEAVIRPSN